MICRICMMCMMKRKLLPLIHFSSIMHIMQILQIMFFVARAKALFQISRRFLHLGALGVLGVYFTDL